MQQCVLSSRRWVRRKRAVVKAEAHVSLETLKHVALRAALPQGVLQQLLTHAPHKIVDFRPDVLQHHPRSVKHDVKQLKH